MGKRANSFLSGLALAAGAVGTVFLFRGRRIPARHNPADRQTRDQQADKWARPGMPVTFRAELMPGRDRETRTCRVVKLLPSNRVLLDHVAGEHSEHEFEPVR